MKKTFGIGALKRKKNMISFLFLKKKEEPRNEEFTTPSPSPTNFSTPSSEMPLHMRSL